MRLVDKRRNPTKKEKRKKVDSATRKWYYKTMSRDITDRTVIYQTARNLIRRRNVGDDEINWVLNQLPHDCDRALGLRVRLMCKKTSGAADWGSVNKMLAEKLS